MGCKSSRILPEQQDPSDNQNIPVQHVTAPGGPQFTPSSPQGQELPFHTAGSTPAKRYVAVFWDIESVRLPANWSNTWDAIKCLRDRFAGPESGRVLLKVAASLTHASLEQIEREREENFVNNVVQHMQLLLSPRNQPHKATAVLKQEIQLVLDLLPTTSIVVITNNNDFLDVLLDANDRGMLEALVYDSAAPLSPAMRRATERRHLEWHSVLGIGPGALHEAQPSHHPE